MRGAVDRITFAQHGSGMLGVAYVKTPFGKVNASDARNFWTVILDSTSFSGPLGYFLPEFWCENPFVSSHLVQTNRIVAKTDSGQTQGTLIKGAVCAGQSERQVSRKRHVTSKTSARLMRYI